MTIPGSPDGRCGAWPEHGGCVLPSGHNRGMADVPGAHQFPRHVTIHLPVVDGVPNQYGEYRTCPQCTKLIECDTWEPDPKRADRVVVTHAGTLHADCYTERMRQADTRLAWAMIARDIARAPSTHSAAEVRATLTALAGFVEADYLKEQARG